MHTNLQCPKCCKPLTAGAFVSIQTDHCSCCSGIWFEGDELRIAKDETDPELVWMDFDLWNNSEVLSLSPSQLNCPACSQSMIAAEYGGTGVTVDYCRPCHGIWLDAGEFEKLIAALQNEVNSKSVGDYVRSSLREAAEITAGPESLSSEWKDFSTVLRLLGRRFLVENPNIYKALIALQRSV